jgi:hypothetical protein
MNENVLDRLIMDQCCGPCTMALVHVVTKSSGDARVGQVVPTVSGTTLPQGHLFGDIAKQIEPVVPACVLCVQTSGSVHGPFAFRDAIHELVGAQSPREGTSPVPESS